MLKLNSHLATEEFKHLNLYAIDKYSFLVLEAAGSGSVELLLTQHKSTDFIMAAKNYAQICSDVIYQPGT
jgi:hypothetical protein